MTEMVKMARCAEPYDTMRELGCFSLQDITDMVGEPAAVKYLVND